MLSPGVRKANDVALWREAINRLFAFAAAHETIEDLAGLKANSERATSRPRAAS
jgi:hypothetical protein